MLLWIYLLCQWPLSLKCFCFSFGWCCLRLERVSACPGSALCPALILSRWPSETQHVPLSAAASVPPAAVGRLQVHPHRLRVLLHVQHQRLPHRLWNPVPAGELQLQDGSHAGYEFRTGPVRSQMRHFNCLTITFGFHFEQEPPLFALLSSTRTVLTPL